jgi:hypothetical protein
MPPGMATLKQPPSWGLENTDHYPFIQYVSDMMLWSLATDMRRIRQGPAAAMQLTGAAKLVVRQIVESPSGLLRLQQGEQGPDGAGWAGLMVLLEALGERFPPLEAELTPRAMHDVMNFHRNHDGGIDQLLIRFGMVRNRAVQMGGRVMTHAGMAWLLMRAIGFTLDHWDSVTDVGGGRMPQNKREFQRCCERMRRMGHAQEPDSRIRFICGLWPRRVLKELVHSLTSSCRCSNAARALRLCLPRSSSLHRSNLY